MKMGLDRNVMAGTQRAIPLLCRQLLWINSSSIPKADKDLKPRLHLNIRFRPVEVLLTLINHEDMSDFESGMP